jgi:hypothetical protein
VASREASLSFAVAGLVAAKPLSNINAKILTKRDISFTPHAEITGPSSPYNPSQRSSSKGLSHGKLQCSTVSFYFD